MRDIRGGVLVALGFLGVQLLLAAFKLTYAYSSPEWTVFLAPIFVYLLVIVIQIHGERQETSGSLPSSASSEGFEMPLVSSGGVTDDLVPVSSTITASGHRAQWSDLGVYSLYGLLPLLVMYLNFGPMYGFMLLMPVTNLAVAHARFLRNGHCPPLLGGSLAPFPTTGTVLFCVWAYVGALKLANQLHSVPWAIVLLALWAWALLLTLHVPVVPILRWLELFGSSNSSSLVSSPSQGMLSDVEITPSLLPSPRIQSTIFFVFTLPLILSTATAAAVDWTSVTPVSGVAVFGIFAPLVVAVFAAIFVVVQWTRSYSSVGEFRREYFKIGSEVAYAPLSSAV